MSKEQAIAFFEEISKNTQLAQAVEKVVGGKGSDEAKAKELISLAQRYNFNFTPEEATAAQGELKKPLSPEEMLEVSGGKINLKSSLMALTLLAGLGVGGAALTNMEASAMKRTTPGYGKSRKIDSTSSLQPQTQKGSQQGSPATTGTYQQATPQPVDAITPKQGETPPSNGQGSTPSTSGQTMRRTRSSRPRTISGEEQHAPKPPREEKKAQTHRKHDNNAAERFEAAGVHDGQFLKAVRGLSGKGHLPPPSWPAVPQLAQSGNGTQTCRYCNAELTIGASGMDPFCKNPDCIFPWTVRRASAKNLLSQRPVNTKNCVRWALLPALILDSRLPTVGCGNNQRPRPAAIMTPAEAWAVWQLIVGHNNDWNNVRTMMAAHSVDQATQEEVIRLLEESYANLAHGNEHLRNFVGSEVQQLVECHNTGWQRVRTTMDQRGYDADLAIELLEKSYNMLTDEQRQLGAQQWQQAEEAMRRAKVTAHPVIEKLQRGEELSLEEARVIAPMLTCGKCGKTGASAQQIGGRVYFRCAKCKKAISNKPADLLAMLEEAVPENVPVEMADAEQDEQQMQMLRANHTFNMNQMNNNNNINNLNNNNVDYDDFYSEDMDFDEELFKLIQALDNENGDENKSPREEKEQPEDYENQERYVPGPGERGYQEAQQQMQMMNQVNHLQQFQPFNTVNDFNDIQQNATEYQQDWYNQFENQMNGQLQTMQNMGQMNGQQQNTQVVQNQQPVYNEQFMLPTSKLSLAQHNMNRLNMQQQNLNQQPMLKLNLHHDLVGDYVNALETDTQELTQCNNLLWELISSGQSGNAEQLGLVVAAAQAVVNRVFARELQDQANQIILNTLGADNRYLEAAQAFAEQFEIFNNVLEIIQKTGQ